MLTIAALLGCVVMLSAEEVSCATYRYASTEGVNLYLDCYMVDHGDLTASRPCMIFAFGGGFVRGQRNTPFYKTYFESLAREGIVVVSIDYRLGLKDISAGMSMLDMIEALNRSVTIAVEDIYAATNYIIEHAEAWGVDTEAIMLSGSSAGAIASIQAEWLRANGDELAQRLPSDFRYAAVVACAGAIFSTDGKPKFKSAPAPMLLFHGTSDSNVPYDKASILGVGFYGSKYIAKQLDKLNSPYLFYSVEYADHSLAGTPLTEQCDLIKQFIRDYVTEGRRMRTLVEVDMIGAQKRPTKFSPMEYLETNYKQ